MLCKHLYTMSMYIYNKSADFVIMTKLFTFYVTKTKLFTDFVTKIKLFTCYVTKTKLFID